MNGAHIHLMLNHFPLIGFVFSFVFLSWGLFRSSRSFLHAGLAVLLISSAIAIPSYLTGEGAEDVLKKRPGFSEKYVEAHESAAELALWSIGLTAAGALVAWRISSRSKDSTGVFVAILALNLVSLVLIGRVNNLGGEISHPEIRSESSGSTPHEVQPPPVPDH